MDKNSGGHFAVPPEMRAFAEKSVEQARQAFESFMSTAHNTVSAMEGQAESTRQGAKDFGRQAMAFAELNIASSFEFARNLMRAKDVNELMKLQSDYIAAQMKTMTEQAKELGESSAKMAQDAATKLKR
jgi:phasin